MARAPLWSARKEPFNGRDAARWFLRLRGGGRPSGRNQARLSGWMLSFPRKRESTLQPGTLHRIPAFAGMTVSLTRGGAGKMPAKKARIDDLAMQGFNLPRSIV